MQHFYSQKDCSDVTAPAFFSTHFRYFLLGLIFCFIGQAYGFQTAPITPDAEVTSTGPAHNKYVVGYYAQWAIYARDFNVSDIEAEHLTHLMYAFYDVKFDANDNVELTTLDDHADFAHTEDPGVDFNSNTRGNFGALEVLKKQNPHLNILMSIGGWTRSIDIPRIANSPQLRKDLVALMVNLMIEYPFIDGFDVDWEFPVTGGISAAESRYGDQPHYDNDHLNLVALLKDMRQGFDAAFPNNRKWVTMAGGNNVSNLLSTHVGPGTESAHGATENLVDYADFITFFGYDFGGNWFDTTSYNAPLYPSNNPEDPLYRIRQEEGSATYSLEAIDANKDGIDDLYDAINAANGLVTDEVPQQALDDLISLYLDYLGIPKEKLIMGIPFYGRLFDNVVHGTVETGLPGLFRDAQRRSNVRCSNGQDGFGRSSPQGSWDAPSEATFFGGECGFSGSIGFSDLSQGVASNPHHLLDINDFSQLSTAAKSAGWVRYWDQTALVPYLYNQNTRQFISYDDEESINLKVNYALQRELGGVMIWELSEDSRSRFGSQSLSNGAALLNQIDTSLNTIQVSLTLNFEDQSGAPINGVAVQLININGTPIQTATTDAEGIVVFPDLPGYRQYSFDYSKSGFAFLPNRKVLEAQSVSANQDITIVGSNNLISFEGTTTLDGIGASVPIELLNDKSEVILEAQSNSDGSFRIENIIGGLNYTITANQEFYSFNTPFYPSPTSDIVGISITGTRDRYQLSGNILTASGATVSMVTVNLSGYTTDSVVTDNSGTFRFENLEAGRNYTLTPNHPDFAFLPQTSNYRVLDQDESVDFVLNEGYLFGRVKDGNTPIANATVQLTLNYLSSSLGYAEYRMQTNAEGEYSMEDTFVYNGQNLKVSDYALGGGAGNIRVLPWTVTGLNLLPSSYDFPAGQIPTSPTQFDFNTQQPAPLIQITAPTQDLISLPGSASVTLTAEIGISPQDDSVSITTVIFTIDRQTITATKDGSTYTAQWSPTEEDFNISHNFRVEATASNGETASESFPFEIKCVGQGCPNIIPEINLLSPSNLTLNQGDGFEAVDFDIEVTDPDGTINQVTISIDGSTATTLSPGSNGRYSYRYTPSAFGELPLVITATDNDGDTTTYRGILRIIDSQFTPLPEGPIILGFAHNWNALEAPFLRYSEIAEDTDYNVVAYSFIEPTEDLGHVPVLRYYGPAYQTAGVFDKQKLIDDIAALKAKGVPVIASIGGALGHFRFNTAAEKDIFVEGIKAIVDEYGFDGLDIDFEGPSMDFGAGALTDFSYEATANYPRLRNTIDAFKELKEYYGSGFILSCAPETFYVQVGLFSYNNRAGSFLPVIHNLREELDLVMVQLYNTGSVNGLDGVAYSQGTPDFIVSMSEMLMRGFSVGSTGYFFEPLPASKILVAIPACTQAAPAGGYLTPTNAIKGLDYLRYGTDFEGRRYTLQGDPQPNLRGMMTWSINWDAVDNCGPEYEFINAYSEYFFDAISLPQVKITQLTSGVVSTTFTGTTSLTVEVILSPMDGTATVSEVIFDIAGQSFNGVAIGNNQYQIAWNPLDSDFGQTHPISVMALATNNQTADLRFSIDLVCEGGDCPNDPPQLNFLMPDPPVVFRPAAFDPVELLVEASDTDGSIDQVQLSIDGAPSVNLISVGSDIYSYNFTPISHKDYQLVFTATDDRSATNSITITLTVSTTGAADADNDGVPDTEDQCPNTPVSEIDQVDVNGCAPSQLVTGTLAELLTSAEWEELFPYRNGFIDPDTPRRTDFYSYQSFANAIKRISVFELMIERRCGTNLQRITHINKATGVETLISTTEFFDASWNANIPIVKESVRYSDFLTEGDLTKRRRELAAFLANISHETTGGPASGNNYQWGLFFKIEGGGTVDYPPGSYTAESDDYPAAEGESYYGRGPIQLSYNYNYGQASEHIFGDKNKLLETPALLETDAEISFMTAIWFWMTPQAPKPSAHDVIIDIYEPSQEETNAGRVNGFGTTVNIINGGVECGNEGEEGHQVVDRINYYKRYTDIFEVSTDLDGSDDCSDCGCANSDNYVDLTFTEDCDSELPGISIITPVNGTLTQTLDLSPVTITTSVSTTDLTQSNFAVEVDMTTYYEQNFKWQPRFFKSYTITATVDIDAIPYYDNAIITLYDDVNAIDCSGITTYVEGVDYTGSSVVNFMGTIYRANYYANDNPTIEPAAWTEIGRCLSDNIAPEIGLSSSTLDDTIFTISATITDTQGVFFIEFYQEGRLMQTVNPRTTLSEVVNTATTSYTVITSSSAPHSVEVRAYDKHGAVSKQSISVQRPANSCGIPQWYEDVEYLFPGGSAPPAYVEYNGAIYRNTGYIRAGENEPDTHANWIEIADSCSDLINLPLAENCDVANIWDPTVINYNINDLVMYNGGLYRVKYFIAGDVVPDRYAAYDFIGLCVNPPVLESAFEGDTTWVMPDTIQSITLSATLDSFGFDPTSLAVGIRPMGSSTTSTYTLSDTGNGVYSYAWTPPAYGIYNLVFVATNSANQQTVLNGNANVVRSLPPVINLLSPDKGSNFVQQSFTAIPINFRVEDKETAVATITVEDLTANTETTLPLEASNTYNFNWTPSAYGNNNLLIRAVNANEDTGILPLNFGLIDPTMETLVLSDPDLFQIIATETITKTFTFDEPITGLKMRDTTLASIEVSGNQLIVSNAEVGRTGLEIITDTGSYFIGLRIDHLDGTVVGLPEHVAVGSVSEDVPNDLAFWQDLNNDNLLKNKQVDTRYIYINGGAFTGWPIDNPTRVVNYVKNSLRYGLIPSFVYYQIPHQNESYERNDRFIRDDEYMRAYFENINLFLDDVQKFIGDELFVVILEPDFLGYIQQRGESVNRATAVGVDQFYDNVNSIDDTQGGTLRNLVARVNKAFDTRRKEDNLNLLFGWQLNLWAKPDAAGHFGIIRETDGVTGDISNTLQEIRSVAEAIGQFGIDAGILTSNADFVSIDKFGLDAIGGPHPLVEDPDPLTQPEEFTWFWNNDHWLNYLDFVDALRDLTQKHIILWQMPVGHINKTQTISAYTGNRFVDLTNEGMRYEDSATTFFFGDEFQLASQQRWDYFTQNKHNDPKLVLTDPTNRILTYGSHMEETLAAGVRMVLMGAGVGASTDGVGNPPTDDYFWIQKVQEYYQNDLVDLPDADSDGVNDFDDQCPNTPNGEEVDVNGCSQSQLDDDNDGVKNNVDLCPFTPAGESVNAGGCSETQLDDDNDGVNNAEDNCPTTPNPGQEDGNGNNIGDACEQCETLDIPVPDLPTLNASCTIQVEAPTIEVCSATVTGTTTAPTFYDEEGNYTIEWTFVSKAGKSVRATQTIIIDDTTEPVAPVLLPIMANCAVTVPVPTAMDACTGIVTGTTSDPVSYDTSGTYTITWAFNDKNGNTSAAQQLVTVVDDTPPIMPKLAPITINCGESITAVATTTDNCAGEIEGTTTTPLDNLTPGNIDILWLFDDGNGNSVTSTQSVRVVDNTPPVAPVISAITSINATITITDIPVAVDACAGTITGTTSAPLTYREIGQYFVGWIFTDPQRNSSMATQTINILATPPPPPPPPPVDPGPTTCVPSSIIVPSLENIVVECGNTIDVPTTTDNCSNVLEGVTTLPDLSITDNYVITWTFTASTGISINVPQNITVVDTTAPTPPRALDPEELGCGETLEAPVIVDSCNNTMITGTTTDPISFNQAGNYQVNWVFTDTNGNQSSAVVQNIIVTGARITPPSLPLLSDSCQVVVSPPSLTDPCSLETVIASTSDPLIYNEVGSYEIDWVFRFADGREVQSSQAVEVTIDSEVTDTVIACDAYVWIDGNTYTADNRSATFIETTAEGCQILHRLDLSIESLDTTILVEDNVLVAQESGAAYQWIDCDNDNTAIAGATQQSFTPSSIGNYAVQITKDACVITTECIAYEADISGVDPETIVVIFPNPPTDNTLNVQMRGSFVSLNLLTIDNKLIFTQEYIAGTSSAMLRLPDLATGIYFLHVIGTDGKTYVKELLIP